ncbi:MAG TPA: antibiotic biosynthesis monooxygenase [Burkholderiales bacterium]|jgi:heme-degrading monooxygenase HmoA
MIAVIFEFSAAPGRRQEYLDIAAALGERLEGFDGFISIERFQSLRDPDKYVSLSFWRDEEAVRRWRNVQQHREAQAKGRAGIFSGYRLRVAQVMRDYTRDRRAETPDDSVKLHG